VAPAGLSGPAARRLACGWREAAGASACARWRDAAAALRDVRHRSCQL